MRSMRWLPFLALIVAVPAFAVEPKCPLDLTTCLNQYQRMKERPWLGVGVERDSLGHVMIMKVEPNSPSYRAGIRAGDRLESLEGKPPTEWFAGKAGWVNGDTGDIAVIRDGKQKVLKMKFDAIPEDVFARVIGVHMIEGHLAHMHDDDQKEPDKR